MTTVPFEVNDAQSASPGGSPTSAPRPRRSKRGQTIAEFALTLPILLFMLFGIIEFGRIFQAWVTIQNAARDAARYAITGNYDQTMFPDTAQPWTPNPSDIFPAGATAGSVAGRNTGHGFPCPASPAVTSWVGGANEAALFGTETAGNDAAYRSHWSGIHCNPGDQVNVGLQTDVLRLASVVRQAQIGASGLGMSQTVNIPGSGINSDPVGADTTPGWFNVFVCSSRLQLAGNSNADPTKTRYTQLLSDWQARKCTIQEADPPNPTGGVMTGLNQNRNQYDAGGPGDFVHVIVFFNHPLITPISWSGSNSLASQNGTQALAGGQGYIQMQASRTMINESFRVSSVVSLSGGVGLAPVSTDTMTPSNTYTPSSTPSITATATQTITTKTNTPTATAYPLCSSLTLTGGSVISTGSTTGYLNLSVQNNNTAPVYIKGATLNWSAGALARNPGMYLDHLQLAAQAFPFWAYDTLVPITYPGAGTGNYTLPTVPLNGVAGGGWLAAAPSYAIRQFIPGASTNLQVFLSNTSGDISAPATPSSMLSYYDFSGTTLSFDLGNGTLCVLTLSVDTPTSLAATNTGTPATPDCSVGNYSLYFTSFGNFGAVKFIFINNTTNPVLINGLNIQWKSYFGGMVLSLVAAGGTTPFDSSAYQVWTGSQATPPTTLSSGTSGWAGAPSINPGPGQNLWLVYNGTSGNLGSQYSANGSDFNGTTVTLSNGCVVTTTALATVLPPVTATNTATYTFTPPTATFTFTPPTSTYTFTPPTSTFTFTPLPPTNTFTPAPPTNTFTPKPPTNTFTPKPPTNTFTPIPPTNTFTPKPPPTNTYTPLPPTATNTTIPPTNTNTPIPLQTDSVGGNG